MGLLDDARNIQRKDPAARSVLEVMLLYPGFHILVYHRIAHWLYGHKHFFLARWVSQHGRHRTGIEIHPGATIGKCLFIDHGMGIVFGETSRRGSPFYRIIIAQQATKVQCCARDCGTKWQLFCRVARVLGRVSKIRREMPETF